MNDEIIQSILFFFHDSHFHEAFHMSSLADAVAKLGYLSKIEKSYISTMKEDFSYDVDFPQVRIRRVFFFIYKETTYTK